VGKKAFNRAKKGKKTSVSLWASFSEKCRDAAKSREVRLARQGKKSLQARERSWSSRSLQGTHNIAYELLQSKSIRGGISSGAGMAKTLLGEKEIKIPHAWRQGREKGKDPIGKP